MLWNVHEIKALSSGRYYIYGKLYDRYTFPTQSCPNRQTQILSCRSELVRNMQRQDEIQGNKFTGMTAPTMLYAFESPLTIINGGILRMKTMMILRIHRKGDGLFDG